VPLSGDRSSLVWVARSHEADAISGMTEAELNREVERRSHSILGKVTADPQRGAFPLTLQTAPALAAARIALISEAAHVIPPIGAQGLNLGLRDAIAIAEHIVDETHRGGDPGSAGSLAAYDSGRQADMRSRSFAVDMLNRSLLTDFLPVQGVRGLGLYLSSRVGPLRRALMREGIGPQSASPFSRASSRLTQKPKSE
jgi:2-octaprenyl-6-methoxyphenol hydroxylase